MNLQFGHAGEDLQSITNMKHRLHTAASISCSFPPSNDDHDGVSARPPPSEEFLLCRLELVNRSFELKVGLEEL